MCDYMEDMEDVHYFPTIIVKWKAFNARGSVAIKWALSAEEDRVIWLKAMEQASDGPFKLIQKNDTYTKHRDSLFL